ncbi:hypothetical protein V5799_014331 [Amblyomma americanum]|uniref:Uncharacterized protein n=2 Tax=Amblyomma americanum TaxID=6943 RepID=A0AAQ4E3D0_AMBAM
MVQVSLSKGQRTLGDVQDPSGTLLLYMRPSRAFLEHASLRRAEVREHFDQVYHYVREYLENKEAAAIPADELYALHQTTRSVLIKALRQSGQVGVTSNRSEVLPFVSEAEWADLLESCCGLASRHIRYRFHRPAFLKEYFALPTKLGPVAAQQYLRWFVMATHIPVFDAASFVSRYGNSARATAERSRFCFRVVRSAMGEAFTCQTVLRSFHKDVVANIENLLPLVYAGFVSVFKKNAWFKPAFHVPDYRNDSGLVFGILEACKPARLEETYAEYGDMTGSFIENWRRVALAMLARLKDSHVVLSAEEHEEARVHYEDKVFAAESPYYRTRPLSADFELLPEASALPSFGDEGPLALRLAVAGAVAADALASLLFQEYDEWDSESRQEFAVQVRCHLGRRITLPELRPAQRRVMHRFLSLMALASAVQDSEEQHHRQGVQGLPRGLRGIRSLFAAWCLQHCGRPGGREACNRPLAEMMLFHNAFFCGPPDTMWKDDACAVLFK